MVDTFLSFFFGGTSILKCLYWLVVFSEVEGKKPRREKRPPPTVRTRETERESEESLRHKESEEWSRHHHTREREEKESAQCKRRNGWLSLSFVVASLPCHYMVDTFSLSLSLSLFCGGFPLSYPLILWLFLPFFFAMVPFPPLLCGGSLLLPLFFFCGGPPLLSPFVAVLPAL